LDREEDPATNTTAKPETTPRKSERLAEEKKPQHLTRFVPKVGGAHILEDYGASGTAEQTIWWANKTASKIDKLRPI
jgi:hypothetical protein